MLSWTPIIVPTESSYKANSLPGHNTRQALMYEAVCKVWTGSRKLFYNQGLSHY